MMSLRFSLLKLARRLSGAARPMMTRSGACSRPALPMSLPSPFPSPDVGSGIAVLGALALLAAADDRYNNTNNRLFMSAQLGDIQELSRLCGKEKNKISPDVRHSLGWTLLMSASANGQVEAVKTLIKCGADINLQDEYHNARKTAQKFNLDPLFVLKKREEEFCPSMTGKATYEGFSALHYAALADDVEIAKLLLESGIDPLLQDYAGRKSVDYTIPGSDTNRLIQQYVDKREQFLKQEERKRFPLEQRLRQFIVGQQGAINCVAAAIRRKENGWADDDHPLVFLFLGSSGIGKTELAKQLAKYIHKDNINGFVRLDMSEYQNKHEVAKLIGSPPGYVGYDEGGQLTKYLAKQNDAVVLFDEVDKAHPDVLTVLLQLFDEGRLTDGKGKLIQCKNAIFVMTSNLASDEIAKYGLELRKEADLVSKINLDDISRTEKDNKNDDQSEEITVSRHFKDNIVRPILKRFFGRDEFLGRINEMVYFLPFSRQELLTLVNMELNIWAERAKLRHSINLKWENGVLGCLADGYDVHYGARSIKYEVERRVISKIALASEKGILEKDCTILITALENGSIDISIKKKLETSFQTVN